MFLKLFKKQSVKQIERTNYLLGKYLENTLSPEEGEELFARLKKVRDPEILDAHFRSGWVQSGDTDLGHLLSWEHLKRELEARHVEKRADIRSRSLNLWKWGIAASFLAVVSFVWWLSPGEPDIITYHTTFGETQEILLDDGTKVILNANSSLLWHKDRYRDSSGSEYRLAELKGEAFFEVSRVKEDGRIADNTQDNDQGMVPFKVRTSDLTVNVLGTAFNLRSRRGRTDVYLDHGSIELELLKEQTELGNRPLSKTAENSDLEKVRMTPGDMVRFSSATQYLEKMEAENPGRFTQWKDGTLIFDNVTFGEMLDRLEDIYGKDFYVQDSLLLQTPVTAGLPYENWETVTKLLEVSLNVELNEEQNNKVRLEKRKG